MKIKAYVREWQGREIVQKLAKEGRLEAWWRDGKGRVVVRFKR